MSIFVTSNVPCPACGKDVSFNTVHSVNADRRADLREQIRAGSFQRETCGACGREFRMDPEFNYLDIGRKQWIAVLPNAELDRWRAHEEQTRQLWARAFGAQAPAAAREVAEGVVPRLVFGWAALWEKLAVDEAGLDDVQLELLKVGLLRNVPESPFGTAAELRFLEVPADAPDVLAFAWIDSDTAEFIEGLRVPRELYDDVAADVDGWKSLRSEFESALLLDMKRFVTAGA